ncbi:MAG: hypothetical protein M3Y37_10190 [Chloroflexota bacterium]|nr:hypothetical protein [Chloroflexota bacterium]
MTDRELRANEERAEELRDAQRDGDIDDGGIIDTLEKPFETFVRPLVTDDVDEDEIDEQRRLNDEATREAMDRP